MHDADDSSHRPAHPLVAVNRRGEPVVPPLRGRGLRFVLVSELMTSKIISDALRWEVRRGRVERLTRGVYRYHRAPLSTAGRIRIFAHTARTWMAATRRNEQPYPTPPDRRLPPTSWRTTANEPPWRYMGWLWTA